MVRVLLSTGSVEVVVDLWVVAGELVNYSQDSQWVAFWTKGPDWRFGFD